MGLNEINQHDFHIQVKCRLDKNPIEEIMDIFSLTIRNQLLKENFTKDELIQNLYINHFENIFLQTYTNNKSYIIKCTNNKKNLIIICKHNSDGSYTYNIKITDSNNSLLGEKTNCTCTALNSIIQKFNKILFKRISKQETTQSTNIQNESENSNTNNIKTLLENNKYTDITIKDLGNNQFQITAIKSTKFVYIRLNIDENVIQCRVYNIINGEKHIIKSNQKPFTQEGIADNISYTELEQIITNISNIENMYIIKYTDCRAKPQEKEIRTNKINIGENFSEEDLIGYMWLCGFQNIKLENGVSKNKTLITGTTGRYNIILVLDTKIIDIDYKLSQDKEGNIIDNYNFITIKNYVGDLTRNLENICEESYNGNTWINIGMIIYEIQDDYSTKKLYPKEILFDKYGVGRNCSGEKLLGLLKNINIIIGLSFK